MYPCKQDSFPLVRGKLFNNNQRSRRNHLKCFVSLVLLNKWKKYKENGEMKNENRTKQKTPRAEQGKCD